MGIPPSIQALWEALQQEVIGIHVYWNNYLQLFGKSKERVDLLNACAGEFFYIVQDALLGDIQLSVSKLADRAESNGQKNATLERLANDIARLPTQQLKPDLTEHLQRYQAECLNIRKRRNKELAHADLGTLLRSNSPAIGTPTLNEIRQEIEQALEALREFFNTIDRHYNGTALDYGEYTSPNDANSLVSMLKQGLRYGEIRKTLPFEDLNKLGLFYA